ncbi:MAG: type 4a pilus biogenesis protein PilO [Candidatus Omnitrophota bacterium]|nr:MAG: type 4a pilus biogenesis protein PilO [Candidatus Omnitrophota bacterium]
MKVDSRLVIIAIIAVVFIIDLVWFTPRQIRTFFGMQSEIRGFKEKITQFNKEKSHKHQYIADKLRVEEDIMNLRSLILTSQDIPKLQAYLSRRAKENGVEVEEIRSAPPQIYKTVGESKFFSLPIHMRLVAAFHSVGKFLNAIEGGEYFLIMKKLSMRGSKPYHRVNIDLWVILKE